jgi:hypothetical protein
MQCGVEAGLGLGYYFVELNGQVVARLSCCTRVYLRLPNLVVVGPTDTLMLRCPPGRHLVAIRVCYFLE